MGAKNFKVINQIKAKLIAAFEMVDMGPINFYLGLKIKWNCERKIIKLFQPA